MTLGEQVNTHTFQILIEVDKVLNQKNSNEKFM